MVILCKIAAKFIDMWFNKKPKPTKVLDIVCPRTGNPLTSEEIFFGMCGSCHRINTMPRSQELGNFCNGGIKNTDHVKS